MSHAAKTKRALGKKRNEETQTHILKLEIARLEEQVKLLTVENDRLRNLNSSSLDEIPRSIRCKQNTQFIESGNTSITMKTCGCKGKCATKSCGCVKRNISCSKLCKCSRSVCQNQEKNDDEQNKENLENIDVLQVEANQISNKVPQEEKHNRTLEDSFDPMKPKYQLPRTPINGERYVNSHTGSSLSILTPDIMQEKQEKKKEEELQVPEEFNQAEVDWDKYQAQLIPCNKCNRKFHPRRIQKHQDCCKKV